MSKAAAPRKFTRQDPIPEHDVNPLIKDYYLHYEHRAPDIEGLKFWTNEMTEKLIPAMVKGGEERGNL